MRAAQRPLDRFVYERCDVVVAASHALAGELIGEHGLDPGRVRVVEPGCDLPGLPPAPDMRRGRRIAVLCVANWLPNKGIHELLDAVRALPNDAVTVHFAGREDVDHRYTRRIRRQLADGRLARRVVAHGPVDRPTVARLYAGADVFALPTRVETYGTAVAEALRAGLPAVGWRTGNLPNLISDGVDGRLLPAGDVAGLSTTIGRLADDEAWRSQLASAARRRGEDLPTWAEAAAAFFGALRTSLPRSVEPAHDGTARLDVDAADAGVLDVQPPGHADGHVERPGQRRLDRADVADDDHH